MKLNRRQFPKPRQIIYICKIMMTQLIISLLVCVCVKMRTLENQLTSETHRVQKVTQKVCKYHLFQNGAAASSFFYSQMFICYLPKTVSTFCFFPFMFSRY